MATIVGTLFGFLGDLVGTHVFTDGAVPQALRRRWNLVGFTVTDDEANGWLTIQVATAGSNLTGVGGTVDVAGGGVSAESASYIQLNAPSVTVDAGELSVGGRSVHATKVHYARVVATTGLTLSGTQTIDGVACIAGDVVAAFGQSSGAQRGLYVVAAGAWSRAPDMNVSAHVASGMLFSVSEGTDNADTIWRLTTNGAITLGTTSLTFAKLSIGLDPPGTLALAEATASAITIGDDSPLHSPDFEANTGASTWASDTFDETVLGARTTICESFAASTTNGDARIQASGGAAELLGETSASLQCNTGGAIHVGDGFGDGDIAATGAIDATAMTMCASSTSLAVGNASCATTQNASTYALTTTGAATLNSLPIRLPYAVRVLSTSNIADLTTVTTVDSVTLADGDLVGLVAQSTPTQNGLYRFTLSTTTLARASAFDSLAEYHLGTTMRAYAGTANKGKAYQLTALSSSLPATWEDITGSGGGGGSSITDGVGTLGIASSGDLTSTGLDTVNIGAHSSTFSIDTSGFMEVIGSGSIELNAGTSAAIYAASGITLESTGGAGGAITLNSSGVQLGGDTGDYLSMVWAGGGECKTDISGTSVRRRVYGTAGTLGLTETCNASATSLDTVGPLAINTACTVSTAGEIATPQWTVGPTVCLTFGGATYIDNATTTMNVRGAGGASLVSSAGNVNLNAAGDCTVTPHLFLANRTGAPSTPTGGGILYVEAGALKYIGSSGTVTPIAPA